MNEPYQLSPYKELELPYKEALPDIRTGGFAKSLQASKFLMIVPILFFLSLGAAGLSVVYYSMQESALKKKQAEGEAEIVTNRSRKDQVQKDLKVIEDKADRGTSLIEWVKTNVQTQPILLKVVEAMGEEGVISSLTVTKDGPRRYKIKADMSVKPALANSLFERLRNLLEEDGYRTGDENTSQNKGLITKSLLVWLEPAEWSKKYFENSEVLASRRQVAGPEEVPSDVPVENVSQEGNQL